MNKWNNKFRYQVASCWLFILSYITMHGSMNIKKKILQMFSSIVKYVSQKKQSFSLKVNVIVSLTLRWVRSDNT